MPPMLSARECLAQEHTPLHGHQRAAILVRATSLGHLMWGKADLQQEECALEVQQADDTGDDDGCEGIERQVLKHGRQKQQHKADECCIHQASCTCSAPNADVEYFSCMKENAFESASDRNCLHACDVRLRC